MNGGAFTVLVTGGSGGIGRAICCEFARAGWRVAVHYRTHRDEAERTCSQVKDLGAEGFLCQSDIRDPLSVGRMFAEITSRWGRLDALIANAGQASSALVLRALVEDWTEVIETNLTGTFHCLQAAGQLMRQQRQGSILIIGSYAGMQGQAGQAAYAASKAGLIGLMKTAAREWGPDQVRVNMILPGWQTTALAASSTSDRLKDHILGRPTALTDVAHAVYSLALLPDASGQVWNLDSRILAETDEHV
jgi:3-oxoacyl-[acyl-carrier protein] reductase